MANTIRKDKNGKKFKEGLKTPDRRYKCRCEYCTGVDKLLLCEKIAAKEMKTEIKQLNIS